MSAYIFPGQGSQILGMGKDLFDEFPELIQKANKILGYSIAALCLEGPEEQLNKTQYTQPALYTVNALTYFKKIKEVEEKPQFVAGHSLGEYNALLAAEVFDFETGLKLVQKRGELMSEAKGGAMAAIIGINVDVIKKILNDNHFMDIAIANYNSYRQTVISGNKEHIAAIENIFKENGAKFIALKVSGAFHSPLMGDAQQKFSQFIRQFDFANPIMPVIANINALPYQPNDVASNLIHQITHSVQWTQSIEYLLAHGVTDIEEIGPGKVLTGLLNKIRKKL